MVTGSFNVPNNQLCLAVITSRVAAADPNHPTMVGWTEVTSVNYDNSGSQKRLTVLRFLGSSSGGTQTIDFAGQIQSDIVWIIDTFRGADTSGTNGSGAIVQIVSNTNVSPATTLSATLSAFRSTINATYGAIAVGNLGVVVTPGAGFIKVADGESATNGIHATSEFNASNDTTVAFACNVSGELGLIAIEINAADPVNAFNAYNYSHVSTNDSDYFVQTGSQNIIEEFKQIAPDNTKNINLTWIGRTTVAPSASPVYLQIYNYNTPAWETLASQTMVPADTDFTLSATQSANLSNYYDSRNTVSARVYQLVV